MEGLAHQGGFETLSTHMLETFPDLDLGKVKRLRNQYWNGIKHFYARDNETARDDETLMAGFTDLQNDAVLFMGWLDYMQVVRKLPIEVQVFQIWWYALNPDKMSPNADPRPWQAI